MPDTTSMITNAVSALHAPNNSANKCLLSTYVTRIILGIKNTNMKKKEHKYEETNDYNMLCLE